MALDLLKERGVALEKQRFTWRDVVRTPISKLDTDAFTRVRVILMNGIEAESLRFKHWLARQHRELRAPLAKVRRTEQLQQTMVNWLLPADQSVVETTLGYEQVAVEVTASVARHEPDPYLAQVYRFGMLEDFDHLYRYAALADRLEGKDANNALQSYTDVRPGRPTAVEHRAPEDDLRNHYDRKTATLVTKLNALVIVSAEQQTHDYYMNVGPLYADPAARLLYAEIAAIEEQHVTQYESLLDPAESPLERWLLHEATEVYTYQSCLASESDARIRAIWEMCVDYELGHVHFVTDLLQSQERRDAAEIIAAKLPEPIRFESHRDFVRETLSKELNLRASGTQFIDASKERPDSPSVRYRESLNSKGSPSEIVAAGYRWQPGTEARHRADTLRPR